MTVGSQGLIVSKLMKSLPDSPIKSYDARVPANTKPTTEYQQAFTSWPWQPPVHSFKPLPKKKNNDERRPMQRKSSYTTDFGQYPTARLKRPKATMISAKPMETGTYNMEFYARQLPEFSAAPVRQSPQIIDLQEFKGDTTYTRSYPEYSWTPIHKAQPEINTRDNLELPAIEDVEKDFKRTVQETFVPCEHVLPPKPIVPKNTEPITKETEYNKCYFDPLKHLHLVAAKIKQAEEKTPKFEAISTAMADYTWPENPKKRTPKIPLSKPHKSTAPFDDRTTFKANFKQWPVKPPEQPVWAKKQAFQLQKSGFVTKSTYAEDFVDPKVVDRDLGIIILPRDPDIISNTKKVRPFNYVSTYTTDYKPKESEKIPPYCVIEKYQPPMMPMATETTMMSDYKPKKNEDNLTSAIRHQGRHHELYDKADMSFVTTYNEEFSGYHPTSCLLKAIKQPDQQRADQQKSGPIPKPDLRMLPKVNAYPLQTPLSSAMPEQQDTPKTSGNTPTQF